MRLNQPRCSNRGGFTLIELLISIAIIALLIGIITPALASSKQKAITLKCQTQLRLLTEAVNRYAELYDNKYPNCQGFPFGVTINSTTGHSSCLAKRMYDARGKYPYLMPPPEGSFRGLELPRSWYCPKKAEDQNFTSTHGSYGYNQRDLTNNATGYPSDGMPINRLPQTSKIGLLRDLSATDHNPGTNAQLRSEYSVPHQGGINISFLDTHIEYSKDPRWMRWPNTGASPCFPYWKANQVP